MVLKDMIRPLPGVQRLSLLRQRAQFHGSAEFWEQTYARGGTSGSGSYGALARGKAEFLNSFIDEHGVQSVIEFGCGDGNQLSLSDYERYIGLDVSPAAVRLCECRFADDPTKSFFLYDGACFVDRGGVFSADLALSLDVIYHLVEDEIFETYMTHLFNASKRYVIIYATNGVIDDAAPHVRHRCFSSWIDASRPEWRLTQVGDGPGTGLGRADFFVYEQL